MTEVLEKNGVERLMASYIESITEALSHNVWGALSTVSSSKWGTTTLVYDFNGEDEMGPYVDVMFTAPTDTYGLLEGSTYGAQVGFRLFRQDLVTLSPTGKVVYGDDALMRWCSACDENLAFTDGLCQEPGCPGTE